MALTKVTNTLLDFTGGFVAGNVSFPAITTVGDTNTGIYFPAADTIAFAEGGVEAARFDSSGNFGIGTATPYRQFQVGNYSTNAVMALGSSPTGTGTFCFSTSDSAPGRYVGLIEYNHTSNYLAFTTNASERARFNSTGAFVLAGGTTTADGIGITFPATQSNSTNANTLDDYEEGTWTPNSSGITVVGTFSSSGIYTKIGRQVTVIANFAGTTSVAVAAGASFSTNIPIASGNFGIDNPGTFYRFGQSGGEIIVAQNDTRFYAGQAIGAVANFQVSATYFV
jgi:hypothetical protein